MATIRKATEDDIDTLASMGERFIKYSEYRRTTECPHGHIADALRKILEVGAIFVAEINGVVRGGIVCSVTPAWFAPDARIAVELAWWVDDDYRNGMTGIRLLQAYERWAKESGASMICMSDMVIDGRPPLGEMLARLGYRMTERTFMKEA